MNHINPSSGGGIEAAVAVLESPAGAPAGASAGAKAAVHPVGSLLAERDKRLRMAPAQRYVVALLVLDVIVMASCLAAVDLFRLVGTQSASPFLSLCVSIPAAVGMIFLIDGYRPQTDYHSAGYAAQHTMALGAAVLVALFAAFVVFPDWGAIKPRRLNLMLGFALFLPISLLYRRDVAARVSRELGKNVLLFLGGNGKSEQFFHDYCRQHGTDNVVFATETGASSLSTSVITDGQRVRADVLDRGLFDRYRDRIGGIVCAEDPDEYPEGVLPAIMGLRLASVPVYSFESFYVGRLRKIPLSRVKPAWLLNEGFRIAHDPVAFHIKRVIDVVVSAGALLVLSPVLLAVAAAVKLTDRGPVFFRQMRVGLNGKKFEILKFRSMTVGAEKGDLYTQVNDSRLTRIGGRLRKWRLDELPQLWNVLKGEMSLIGPRAEWDKLVESYEEQISCYHFRHLVKPGITGWAQVNYPYGANLIDTKRKLEFDLYYIRHYSLLLDASIVFKTLNTMLFGKGV